MYSITVSRVEDRRVYTLLQSLEVWTGGFRLYYSLWG